MINTHQLNKNLRRTSAQDIFHKLDTGKTGIVSSEEFISLLEKIEEGEWIEEFFKNIQTEITSKSVIIIKKLKEIKANQRLNGDSKTLDDLDWYILTFF
jgi:hypothetical protein